MKKTMLITAISISSVSFSQEKEYRFFGNGQEAAPETAGRAPGDPGDPVPIDGYIPLLLIAGLALAARYAKCQSSTIESADKN
ncbi:hypothetical protein [Chryseobacterium sp.]|uniref:hypothetical protein n=1 Tax=Chryseobacterium sp. TaxID=1871047 RepID=UPI0011CB664F|nr:hypothetical protein [Chryseobacterium sp.]TXF77513.1 hypothetical protein FUA25_06185 [Chryseobacterium sp.]